MFDPAKAALLILSGGESEEEDTEKEDGSGGPAALRAMFLALRDGKDNEAYDAFRAAVESCGEYEDD